MGERTKLFNQVYELFNAGYREEADEIEALAKVTCECGGYADEQYDFYGIYAGRMCDDCFSKAYNTGPYFDASYAGESLEPNY